jgi:hypothetical protein
MTLLLVLCGHEMFLAMQKEHDLYIFEDKIFRKLYGPGRDLVRR